METETGGRLTKISSRLSDISVKKYNNPYLDIEWPEALPKNSLCFSPEMISISELSEFKDLNVEQVNKLALFEAVNFFSLNISGEKELIAGLSTRLYKDYPDHVTEYIHHFLDEENKHMIWFGTFSEKYGKKVYQDKKVVFPREYAPGEEDFLFFAKIVIFEEIVDHYNIHMAKDEKLAPLVRQIHQQHHDDESRHLGFGREITTYIYDMHKSSWSQNVKMGISDYLKTYMAATWREYYNPEVYRDCGMKNDYELMKAAWESKREQRYKISEKCMKFFLKNEFIVGDIEL